MQDADLPAMEQFTREWPYGDELPLRLIASGGGAYNHARSVNLGLAEATTDEDLAAELGAAGRSSDERLAGVIRAVAQSRSRVQPLMDRSRQDIVDPFRKSEEAHRVSARQIAAAVDRVAELFRRALEISRGAGIRPVPTLPVDTWVVADQVALTGAENLGAEPEAGNATQFA